MEFVTIDIYSKEERRNRFFETFVSDQSVRLNYVLELFF